MVKHIATSLLINLGYAAAYYAWEILGIEGFGNLFYAWFSIVFSLSVFVLFFCLAKGDTLPKKNKTPPFLTWFNRCFSIGFMAAMSFGGHFILVGMYLLSWFFCAICFKNKD